MKTTSAIIVIALTLAAGTAQVPAQVSSSDFLPPVQGGPTDVKKPNAVKIDGKTVAAATAQDAINAAVQQNVKDNKAGSAPEVGCNAVSFPSGLGYVSTGCATYRTMENPTATRIAKRQAYVIAYTHAKKGLAETLNGLSDSAIDKVRESLKQVTLPKEDLVNISTNSRESLRQTTQMMLRGFVVYQVQDDTANQTVYVTIVTTPKTRGQHDRPTPSSIQADTLRDGIEQVIAEVKSGIVSPVGGRIILVTSTGEQAYVGFGSCIIDSSTNSAAQAKLNLEAQKIADMRAKDSLCGLIVGDQTCWCGGVTESMRDNIKEFEPLTADDPLAKNNDSGVKKLDSIRQTFVATHQSADFYVSARKGILPPGIVGKTWFDEDHAWAYGMAVYIPSLTNAASNTADEMRKAKILQPINGGAGESKSDGFTDESNPNTSGPLPATRQGPSGEVSPKNGL